jgi:hypothetical protein
VIALQSSAPASRPSPVPAPAALPPTRCFDVLYRRRKRRLSRFIVREVLRDGSPKIGASAQEREHHAHRYAGTTDDGQVTNRTPDASLCSAERSRAFWCVGPLALSGLRNGYQLYSAPKDQHVLSGMSFAIRSLTAGRIGSSASTKGVTRANTAPRRRRASSVL